MPFKAKSDKKSAWGRRPSGGSSDGQRTYTLQVQLLTERPMTCTIEVAGTHTLEQLQEIIDQAFDRTANSMWDFQTGVRGHYDSMNRRYGPPDHGDDLADDASETTIDDLKLKEGGRFAYTSDLNSPSEHAIEVVNIGKAGRTLAEPRIVKQASQTAGGRAATVEPRAPQRANVPAPTTARPPGAPPERDAQAAACSYILVALLQRLEKLQPGLTRDLLAGIEADRAAVSADVPNREFIEKIFDEALKTVRQAAAGIS